MCVCLCGGYVVFVCVSGKVYIMIVCVCLIVCMFVDMCACMLIVLCLYASLSMFVL